MDWLLLAVQPRSKKVAQVIQAIYSRRSMCACGYPVLEDSVKLGTQYFAFDLPGRAGWMICGGCGLKLDTHLILVRRADGGKLGTPGIMPREIFAF
jgi:hypothetical protein